MAGNQTPPSIQQIIDRADWRRTLAQDYEATARRLQSAYERIMPRLRDAADDLSGRLRDWEAANPDDRLRPGVVRGMGEYQDLLRRVDLEMTDFAALLRSESGDLQEKGIVAGIDAGQEMAEATAGNLATIIQTQWNRPSPETLKMLIGYADGEAFRQKARAFGENAAANIADVILAGVAQGKGPRAIAGLMSNWLLVPYSWAENTARTIQNWSFRGANHASYAANERLLNGWVWHASLDGQVCMSCVSQHGQVYPVTQTLNDHHRGRCAPVPWVRGTTWPETMITGPNWFESQPETFQRRLMGGAMYNAWSAGAILWQDMSQPYHDDVYGPMLREASVSGVLGAEDAKRYYVFNY